MKIARSSLPRPPHGISKWNKIEHRLFSRITQNWPGYPLASLKVCQPDHQSHDRNNLNVHAKLDPNTFATGRKVTKLELKSLNLNVSQDTFHGEWKYSLTFN